jgi:PKD repeat protein
MLFRSNSLTRLAALGCLAGPLLVAGCKNNDTTELEGPVPTANFTSSVDASQFPVVVTFTNTSQDGFLYQWNFGDGSNPVSGTNVKHTYQRGGTFKVQLTAAGRGGTNVGPSKDVVVPTACGNAGFAGLTACGGSGAASWTISNQPGAIVRLAADGTTVLSSLPAAGGSLPGR